MLNGISITCSGKRKQQEKDSQCQKLEGTK